MLGHHLRRWPSIKPPYVSGACAIHYNIKFKAFFLELLFNVLVLQCFEFNKMYPFQVVVPVYNM